MYARSLHGNRKISGLTANARTGWRPALGRRGAKGRVIVVPGSRSGPTGASADGINTGFELEADAKRFWQAMSERLGKFGLELHEGKTRLLEFGQST